MNLLDLIKFLLAFGYPWGIPSAIIALAIVVVWKIGKHEWNQGRRRLKLLFAPSVLVASIACIAAASLACTWYWRYWGLPRQFSENETGILIASIPDDQDHIEQQTYAQAIRRLAYDSPDLAKSVKVELIERPLPDDPEAQQQESLVLGRRLHAALVLRAVRVEGGHESWLTIVDQPDFQASETHVARVSQSQLLDIDKLPLPSDILLMARCALASAEYHRAQYEPAVSSLRLILQAPHLLPAAPSRPYLSLLLGNSYVAISSSNPLATLPPAISAYEEALNTWAPEKYPDQWAAAATDLAIAYAFLPGGGEPALEKSAKLLDSVLPILRKTGDKEGLAAALVDRSNTYRDLLGPDRDANVREAVSSADQALVLVDKATDPIPWAKAMQVRGSAYRELPGSSRDNLEEAIHSADLAMAEYKRQGDEHDWAVTMNNRGTALNDEALAGISKGPNLKEAIACFEQALQVLTRERYPFEWARTVDNLATSYAELPGSQHNENVRKAIGLLGDALTVRTLEADRPEWAASMLNTATAYLNIEGPESVEAAKVAIRYCDTVLAATQVQDNPRTIFVAFQDRGQAYAELAGPDRSRNLWEAIRSWNLALAVQRSRVANDKRGMLMYNRGNLYLALGKTEEAIGSYDDALKMVSSEHNGSEWAKIMTNRGAAYLQLRGRKEENVREALRSFDLALAARPHNVDAIGWATTLVDKGIALTHLSRDRVENLQEAISCFDQALQVLTPAGQADQWAMATESRKEAQEELDHYKIPTNRTSLDGTGRIAGLATNSPL